MWSLYYFCMLQTSSLRLFKALLLVLLKLPTMNHHPKLKPVNQIFTAGVCSPDVSS